MNKISNKTPITSYMKNIYLGEGNEYLEHHNLY
jgi:hypothetical protein